MSSLSETILNIYLIVENKNVVEFRAKAYESDDGDTEKIQLLKKSARNDLKSAYKFDAPENEKGEFMPYKTFAKLEKRGMHFELFEEIFSKFNVPQNPLVCVTPIVDGEFKGE